MAKIIVIKPFVFSHLADPRHRTATEQKFAPNLSPDRKGYLPREYEVPDDHPMLQHPWITEHFADGAIEKPEATTARVQATQAKVEAENAENARIQADAERTFARVTAAATGAAKASEVASARDMHTPNADLRAQRGEGIDQQPSEEELNTPVSELQQRQSKRAAGK